ncbi:hypothetical protein GGD67_002821 [Bradyrhizobium sp. IAR9]|nr:hypothetical protein [Bradyrhizobium sp. IAR9]
MATARRPPSSEPAKIQFLLSTATRPKLALGGIVRHAKPSVIKEAAKCIPAAEALTDDEGAATLLAHTQTLLRSKTVDLALDGEQDIEALDRLGRDRRLAEPREIKEFAPAVRPARGFHD